MLSQEQTHLLEKAKLPTDIAAFIGRRARCQYLHGHGALHEYEVIGLTFYVRYGRVREQIWHNAPLGIQAILAPVTQREIERGESLHHPFMRFDGERWALFTLRPRLSSHRTESSWIEHPVKVFWE